MELVKLSEDLSNEEIRKRVRRSYLVSERSYSMSKDPFPLRVDLSSQRSQLRTAVVPGGETVFWVSKECKKGKRRTLKRVRRFVSIKKLGLAPCSYYTATAHDLAKVGGADVKFVAHSTNCGYAEKQTLSRPRRRHNRSTYCYATVFDGSDGRIIPTRILRCGLQIYHRLRRLVTKPAIDVIAIIGARAANAVSFVFIVLMGGNRKAFCVNTSNF